MYSISWFQMGEMEEMDEKDQKNQMNLIGLMNDHGQEYGPKEGST